MSFQFFRRFFHEIHLWLGIVSGIILFIVCLSGSIFVFRDEAQHIAEPAKYYVEVPEGKAALSADELIAKVETDKPGMKVASITIPEKPNRTVAMNLTEPGQSQGRTSGGHGGGSRGRNVVYVNPYTGDITGEGANVVDPFFMSMMQLHRWLWFSGEWRWIGKMIVGIATMIFIVICLTGVILWLPRTWKAFMKWKAWKPGLRIRLNKGIWPFLYDTHNTIGFYLLIPALILALTGLCWSFRWYNNGLGTMLGLDGPALQRGGGNTAMFVPPDDHSIKPLSVGRMIDLQNELTPGPGEIVVSIPQIGNASQRGEENRKDRGMQAMIIQKGSTGFFSLAFKDRTQWDYYRGKAIPVEYYGKTVEVERFTDRPLRNQIAGSIRAIHFGNITGLSSKIFFFVVCLFATSWPVTGVALWVKKLRAKHKKRKAQPTGEATAQNDAPQSVLHHHISQ